MHVAIYRQRPDVRAVLHLHAPMSIALSTLVDATDDGNVLPPITPYAVMRVGRVPMIEYIRPGSPRLAARVGDVCAGVHAILLANHGIITFGPTLDFAVDVAEELENTARIFLTAGLKARLLPPAEAAALADA